MKGVGEVSAVSVQGAGQSTWITAVNKWGAQWEVNNMPGSGPYNLYIVLADNSRVRMIALRQHALNRSSIACHNGTVCSQGGAVSPDRCIGLRIFCRSAIFVIPRLFSGFMD